jgi:hypothetical protein
MNTLQKTYFEFHRTVFPIFSIVALSLFLIAFSDKDGYEGDDLNSVVPSFHLEEMREGLIEGYRYDWQPLSYQLSSLIFEITGQPDYIFLIAPISIALSITILFLLFQKLYNINFLTFFCLILMIPELLYTGLYYNSHAPAILFYVLSIYFVLTMQANSPFNILSILIGLFLSTAILFRLDFVLVVPIVITLLYFKSAGYYQPVLVLITMASIGAGSLVFGLIDFFSVLEIYQTSSQEIADKASSGGWDRRTKLLASTTIFSPLGWLFFSVGILFFLNSTYWNLHRQKVLIIFVAALPLLYPIKDLLSVKYAVPFLIITLIAAAHFFSSSPQFSSLNKRPLFLYLFYLGSLFFSFVYVNIDNETPYVQFTVSKPIRNIGTHDGQRSWGGYFNQFINLASSNHDDDKYIKAKLLTNEILTSDNTIWLIIGDQNYFQTTSLGWRYVQLFLAGQVTKSEVTSKNHIKLYSNSNTIHICPNINCLETRELVSENLKIVYPGKLDY